MATEQNSTRRNLTDKFCSTVRPTDGRRVIYWDANEPGLGLCVQPSGYKSFVVIRRISGGKPVKYVIRPEYPVMTLQLAREKARDVKRDLSNGINPRQQERERDAERERLKAEEVRVSFSAVAEQYIARKLTGLRSAKLFETVIRRDLLSRTWSRKPIAAVTKQDIVSMITDIRTDKDRSTPGQWSTSAMKAFNAARQILAWALTRDEFGLDVNVTTRINLKEEMAAEKPQARERILSDVEFAAFWRACDRESYPGGRMLQMLALSCVRLNEIAGCQWSEFSVIDDAAVELRGPVLTIPASRMKGKNGRVDPHTVPITPLMQSILDSLPRFVGDSRFVFSNKAGRSPLSGFGQLKARIDAAMREELPDLPHWTFHDLRRSARSNLSRIGIATEIGERCLAHRLSGVRGVYDRYQFLAEKREALTKLSELYARIIQPIDNVEQLPRRTAS